MEENLLRDKICEGYLIDYINKKWKTMNKSTLLSNKRFPFAIEEAVLNAALTGCIFQYMHDNGDHLSTLVSEGKVRRARKTDIVKGHCDIIWYHRDTVYYVELKNAFYNYSSPDRTVKEAFRYIKEAIKQVNSIISKYSLVYDNHIQNEHWYGCTPNNRRGFVCAIVFSEVINNESWFSDYQQLLGNGNYKKLAQYDDYLLKNIEFKVYEKQFKDCPLDISYYKNEDSKEMDNVEADGYFFICAEFELSL